MIRATALGVLAIAAAAPCAAAPPRPSARVRAWGRPFPLVRMRCHVAYGPKLRRCVVLDPGGASRADQEALLSLAEMHSVPRGAKVGGTVDFNTQLMELPPPPVRR